MQPTHRNRYVSPTGQRHPSDFDDTDYTRRYVEPYCKNYLEPTGGLTGPGIPPINPTGNCYDFNSDVPTEGFNQAILNTSWKPSNLDDWAFQVELQWSSSGLHEVFTADTDDNGAQILQLAIGDSGGGQSLFAIVEGQFVLFSAAELGNIVQGEMFRVKGSVGANSSDGAGLRGTIEVLTATVTVTKSIPDGSVILGTEGVFALGTSAGGANSFQGVIRDLYLTDRANASNSVYWPIHEGTGDTFISQPAGNNAVVTNHTQANWVECPPTISPDTDWVMFTGSWNDNGTWYDNATWNDTGGGAPP